MIRTEGTSIIYHMPRTLHPSRLPDALEIGDEDNAENTQAEIAKDAGSSESEPLPF
jgi:hypothetical protein